jgi:hypothetical protein
MLPQHSRNELGAGSVRRIVEFFSTLVSPEMKLILFAQKSALMMIKPPGQPRVGGIFKINDGVLVSVKLHIKKEFAGAMSQSLVDELAIIADCSRIEAAKDSR